MKLVTAMTRERLVSKTCSSSLVPRLNEATVAVAFSGGGGGAGEGPPNPMPMIRLESVENHRMYCLMPSDNFILKKSGTQAGIEPTTFGAPTHCSNH